MPSTLIENSSKDTYVIIKILQFAHFQQIMPLWGITVTGQKPKETFLLSFETICNWSNAKGSMVESLFV